MQEVIYKQKDGMVIHSDTLPEYFTGYKITKDHERLSSVLEYTDGKILGHIKYRPTKTPVIFSVVYGCYNEGRYNNGSVNRVFCTDSNSRFNGEFIKFSMNGEIEEKRYYSDSDDVTQDIKSFIGFNGDIESFKYYKFKEDELFNIYMLYGSKFKLYNEYKMDSSYFDDVTKFCLK